jgi:hypothetical protein
MEKNNYLIFFEEQSKEGYKDLLLDLDDEQKKEKIKQVYDTLLNNIKNSENVEEIKYIDSLIYRIYNNEKNIQVKEINLDILSQKFYYYYDKMNKLINDLELINNSEFYINDIDVEVELIELFTKLWIDKYKITKK